MDRCVNPSEPSPTQWKTWISVLVKFGLFASRSASIWIFIVRGMADRAIHQTHELDELRRDQLETLGIAPETLPSTVELRRAARIAFAKRAGFCINPNVDIRVANLTLIRTFSGKTLEQPRPPRMLGRFSNELALPANSPKLGPSARIRAQAASGPPIGKISEFAAAGRHLDILKNVGKPSLFRPVGGPMQP